MHTLPTLYKPQSDNANFFYIVTLPFHHDTADLFGGKSERIGTLHDAMVTLSFHFHISFRMPLLFVEISWTICLSEHI